MPGPWVSARQRAEPPSHLVKRLVLSLWLLVAAGAPLAAEPVSSVAIRDHLIRWEGYRLSPYRDGPGWSVGVGHSITANAERRKARYTAAEVERLLWADVSWALDAARQGIRDFDDLPPQVQLIALGVAFGTGRTGFHRFQSFRLALSRRAYNAAAHELAHSRWATQVSPERRTHYVNTLLRL